jgi:hypothetical protein
MESSVVSSIGFWIPACAGMTSKEVIRPSLRIAPKRLVITAFVSEWCKALRGAVGDISFVFRKELNEQAIAVITDRSSRIMSLVRQLLSNI